MTLAAGAICAITILRWPRRWPIVAAVSIGAMGGLLLGIAAGAAAIVAVRSPNLRRANRDTLGGGEALVALDAVALGVAGGLSFEHAASIAADAVGGEVADDIRRSLRTMPFHSGVAPGSGPVASLFATAELSRATGAPMAMSLAAAARDLRADRAAAARRRLARMPVRLLFPLALLILPGFVLMAVAPTVVSGLARLGL